MMRIKLIDMLYAFLRSQRLRSEIGVHVIGSTFTTETLRAQRRRAYRTLLLITLVALLCACNSNDTSNNTNAPVISGQPQTSLPMPPLNGKSITNLGWQLTNGTHSAFSELNGKVVVLDFYATWCEPCRRSIPHLVDLQKRYMDDVRVVGLNVGGPEDVSQVPNFAREFQIQYQLGVPDDDLVSLLLSSSDAIPQTFIFDRNGKLVRNFVGFGDDTGSAIDQAVAGALVSTTSQ
ncbi:MAG TPA: TlpA disulfide reductase family protein [Pyrinomonadaceae bacterium]